MNELRDSRDSRKAWAHQVLDEAKAGTPTLSRDIDRALRILGDLASEAGNA